MTSLSSTGTEKVDEPMKPKGPNFRRLVRAARLAAEGKVCYACGQKLPAAPPAPKGDSRNE